MRLIAACDLIVAFVIATLANQPPLAAATSGPDKKDVERSSEPLDFGRDVRPILSDHCFACHGPDEHDRRGGLRLDQADGVDSVIEAGHPEESELVRRLYSEDELMPPQEYGKPLSKEQKAILERWISEGGEFQGHWAFQAPTKAAVPTGTENAIDHFIESRITKAGLKANGMASSEALLRRVTLGLTGLPPSREQIERARRGELDYERLVDELLASPAFGQHFGRYWLDLVRYADTHGLHLDNYREMWPYRDWVIDAINKNLPYDQFITEQLAGDLLPDATLSQQIASGFNRLNVTTNEGGSIYEEVFARNVIDRTDSFGTIFLGLTTQCAVCHDHKFDPITQKDYYSLSAFFNSLDGRAMDGNKKDHPPVVQVPSEQQLAQLADFDRQIEELEREMEGEIETVDQAQRQWELSLQDFPEQASETGLQRLIPKQANAKDGGELKVDDAGVVYSDQPAKNKNTLWVEIPIANLSTEQAWQTVVMDVLPDPKTNRAGVSANGNAVLTEFTVEAFLENEWQPIAINDAIADIEQQGGDFKVTNAIDGRRDGAGWAIGGHQTAGGRSVQFGLPDLQSTLKLGPSKLRFTLDFRSVYTAHQFYAMKFSLTDQAPQVSRDDWITLGPIYSAGPFAVESSAPGYSRVFVSEQRKFDPEETFKYRDQEVKWTARPDWSPVAVHTLPINDDSVAVNVLYQKLTSPKEQTIDLLLGSSDGHVVYLNNRRLQITKAVGPINPLSQTYALELRKGVNDLYIKTVSESRPAQVAFAYRSPAIPVPKQFADVVSQDASERSDAENQSIRTYYRKVVCEHPDWTALQDMVRGLEKAKENVRNEIPTTLVWKELDKPRDAHILVRGQYDQPGEQVTRDVPQFLPSMEEGLPRDRLGLAKWLTAPGHPLTARVTVNRVWQWLFGSGLVKSSEDFGSQGNPPSHPELLDWLAVDFQENGWDMKRLIKQMVTSKTYRRDATVMADQLSVDPGNRLFARGPRFRLDAEVLRDQALSLAGLLNEQPTGPSVKPPQPSGLWYAVGYTRSNTANFKADTEPEKRLRRSVYIFWKRTSPPPQMSTFDAPSRESCIARRERTNTPLQALVLMNENQYLKAAKHLAQRTFRTQREADDASRLTWMFETVTARPPSDHEAKELMSLLSNLRSYYREDVDAASELLSVVDETLLDETTADEQAAWMMVASTLLNLDETVNN
ncbi:PSD1 and planctomycete cytochrome C domain-containing protein [Roseiconus lacunae]|uniref:PSD1 and planctomycete cytochrome C domain-containing protein n=1 Tax=Roseiconus lacunae TaxID=2605694 RepID=UPI001E4B5B42|nr:PSD1 and planctomycete cytochrome C domain-containing protein [Roseiconus lacunae]MCD0462398.1 PSD1 and planctomycete cytochrome C domain-containing protein [Roseiconus lacunae]